MIYSNKKKMLSEIVPFDNRVKRDYQKPVIS